MGTKVERQLIMRHEGGKEMPIFPFISESVYNKVFERGYDW